MGDFGPGVLAYEKKLIFARFFGTASVRSRSLKQPLVPGVFNMLLLKDSICQIFLSFQTFINLVTNLADFKKFFGTVIQHMEPDESKRRDPGHRP